MQRVDRWVGVALAALGAVVLWTARDFPNVPGQKLGAAFLPMLVGVGLVVCALLLMLRSFRVRPTPASEAPDSLWAGARLAPLAVIGSIGAYVLLAESLGFLIVAPVLLFVLFLAFGRGVKGALWWALAGGAVVHLVFYKMLRVPLPWGVIPPFY